ncbi:adenosine receptor A2a-like [Hippocampus comes]|uniref:adenosine receptor A2a-like n=1 Tax=Hippocampus comes TaxID=109280 RepID=UPI00094E7C88|nr:PREDICTED: adenosine receptor A2a-like [Hippocampus comes]XP_019738148.1 PREDICTED: adenosine receptor A2a-like [Hippocampus comes]
MLKNYHLVYIGLELAIACLAVAGNILVCWAVCLNSNLQSITNLFVVSLAAADIAVGLLAIPFAITISTGFCADFHGCLFIACFVLVLTQSSIFSLLAIAVDRYIAIKNPLRYNSLVTSQRAKGIIAFCWLLSVAIGLTPMLGWNKGWNSTTASTSSCPEGLTECLFEGVVTLDYMIYFNFFGCVLLPLVVMLVVYAHIFMAARRQLRLMGLKKVAPAPSRAEKESSSFRSTLHKEVHAAKSLAIIVGLFAFCWLPVHIINCFNYLCDSCQRPHIWVMNIAIILSHANSVVNPFIYAYRIREFRQTFRRILHQHILGQRDNRCLWVGSGDGRDTRSSSIKRTSSRISKDDSSCGTVVNSYVLDSSQWTSTLGTLPNSCIPNGNLTTQQSEGTNSEEVRDIGSAISFVNVQALSYIQTHSTELTEVS